MLIIKCFHIPSSFVLHGFEEIQCTHIKSCICKLLHFICVASIHRVLSYKIELDRFILLEFYRQYKFLSLACNCKPCLENAICINRIL